MSDIEHVLVKTPSGQFALNHPGDTAHVISSGHRIEVFYERFWHEGKVEHAREHGGYYFEADEDKRSVPLQEGMIIRLPD